MGTIGKTFDAHEFQASLSRRETAGQFVMDIELLPDASDQNEYNLNDLAIVLVENMAAIQRDQEPFMMEIQSVERGFILLTPDLKDFTTLYGRISNSHGLFWDDPKFCAEIGRDYSLADLKEVIALVPEADDDGMDRPLDMGLPKPRLQ